MARYIIQGGTPLHGEVTLSGAKNLAGKLILASLLTGESCKIDNVPTSGETDIALDIARTIGSDAQLNGHELTIHTPTILNSDLSHLPARNRHSVLAIGPLLFRTGEAVVPRVGGDSIGARRINFHVSALTALGATITETDHGYRAECRGLTGTTIDLPYPSVGTTETILMTASWAHGVTRLTNAAIEPEIIELVHFLNAMGAKITKSGERSFEIEGVRSFHGAHHTVIADRIEAVSYMSAAVATRGDIIVRGATRDAVASYLEFLDRLGAHHQVVDGGIRVWAQGPLQATNLTTATHPGFMTDWQQPSAVILATVHGQSRIHETVYSNRLGYLADLQRMGAQVAVTTECPTDEPCRYTGQHFEHVAMITGPTPLHGTGLTIPDIRAGMAHVIAALLANGESRLLGIHHLDRGYERLDEKLQGLGAAIVRSEEE